MLKKWIYILIFLISANTFAGHNRAGEITYTHITGTTYKITVTTYTKASSPSDRPKLEIRWGDSSPLDSISRISKILIGNDIDKNIYEKNHTFPGASPLSYIISIEDPNRTSGIMNIPNSVNVVFYIETKLYINSVLGINNSPVFQNNAVDSACLNNLYSYNFGGTDVDGDSLYYTLQPTLKEGGQSIATYQFPIASSSFTINNSTGEVVWNTPIFTGLYNFDVLVEEFRNGQKFGNVLREIQIDVKLTCAAVGVNEQLEAKLNFQIYPNPNNGNFTIDIEGIDNAEVELYTISGQLILQKSLVQNTTKVDLTKYQKGIYFVKVKTYNKTTVKKIIYQ